ncbi:hypothetical protein JCGZ_18615 [Jatropha curcas]|uniref:Uncharacterized protein n=1 Tax=Jatropha curcas TaxID=180498 RepID=A0A067KDV3_JATCU|nr:hypothetical protein JCGZ_18615 [Jatropha curcas]
MEALWNLEDKWKLTTQQAELILIAFTAFAVIGLCTVTVLKRKAQSKQTVDPAGSDHSSFNSSKWVRIRRLLIGWVRWSEANKWGEASGGKSRRRRSPLLGFEEDESPSSLGWQSHNSASPVWQRPILMGEKCELPRFSGLILYDESGHLLHHSLSSSRMENIDQVIIKPRLV